MDTDQINKEVVKRKRGRPRKVKLPDEIQQLIDKTTQESPEIKNEEIKDEEINNEGSTEEVWDISIDQKIDYFDPTLSYEITGYKPINDTNITLQAIISAIMVFVTFFTFCFIFIFSLYQFA